MRYARAARMAMSTVMCLLLMMLILANVTDGARWPVVPLH
jgi:hypothetical protein